MLLAELNFVPEKSHSQYKVLGCILKPSGTSMNAEYEGTTSPMSIKMQRSEIIINLKANIYCNMPGEATKCLTFASNSTTSGGSAP